MDSIPLSPGYCTLLILAKGLKKGIVSGGTEIDSTKISCRKTCLGYRNIHPRI